MFSCWYVASHRLMRKFRAVLMSDCFRFAHEPPPPPPPPLLELRPPARRLRPFLSSPWNLLDVVLILGSLFTIAEVSRGASPAAGRRSCERAPRRPAQLPEAGSPTHCHAWHMPSHLVSARVRGPVCSAASALGVVAHAAINDPDDACEIDPISEASGARARNSFSASPPAVLGVLRLTPRRVLLGAARQSQSQAGFMSLHHQIVAVGEKSHYFASSAKYLHLFCSLLPGSRRARRASSSCGSPGSSASSASSVRAGASAPLPAAPILHPTQHTHTPTHSQASEQMKPLKIGMSPLCPRRGGVLGKLHLLLLGSYTLPSAAWGIAPERASLAANRNPPRGRQRLPYSIRGPSPRVTAVSP